MRDATLLCNDLLRNLAAVHNGVEVAIQGGDTAGAGCMCMAFADAAHARAWCAGAQVALVDAPWPRALLDAHHGAAEVFVDADDGGDDDDNDDNDSTVAEDDRQRPSGKDLPGQSMTRRRRLYAGLRVRMAIHMAHPRWHREPGVLPACSGADVQLCCRLAATAAGGRVLLTAEAAMLDTGARGDDNGNTGRDKASTPGQAYTVDRITYGHVNSSDDDNNGDDQSRNGRESLYELRPHALRARRFEDIAKASWRAADPTSESVSAASPTDGAILQAGGGLLASANACRWIHRLWRDRVARSTWAPARVAWSTAGGGRASTWPSSAFPTSASTNGASLSSAPRRQRWRSCVIPTSWPLSARA
ncbi:ser/thr kinase [Pandoravirus inopinatum]|uniref:Ser/thr kinase n=1 Tax=Pandoravirus inopinatum TaxID=1605721 RepID=A0A0B5JB43_9VIRU|nr:ser/thr kinase [Pandoravirus inopinatum]AJF96762.1 ser/thr kinase [Pandoravirus inopinatum]